ncbi:MAG: UDP-N-acetylmuramate--L-alanine ligase [Acidimicrobiia bacterium]
MTDNRIPDLSQPQAVHILGVGGAGMSAIATVLHRFGHRVSGSDLKSSRDLERVHALGVATAVGHAAQNIPEDCSLVVHSTAVGADNVELGAARARGIPVYRRAEVLAAMTRLRRTIAVAGSHGKTTTTSMLSIMLRRADMHPSFLIGGEVNEIGTNAATDSGELFIVEADESDGTFVTLARAGAIVTNVEPDHLDHYGGFDGLVAAFEAFADGVDGPLLCCADDAGSRRLTTGRANARTYGFAADADVRIANYVGSRAGSHFDLVVDGSELGHIELPVAGRHNAQNAAGAAAMAMALGASFPAIASALATFGGVARRFQMRGEFNGATFIDDYAHLPSEVQAAIIAAREGSWGRVIVVFQPHRYTRTRQLWSDFAGAFVGADRLILTDVYSSGESPIPGVTGRLILRAVLDANPEMNVMYLPHREDLVREIPKLCRNGDVVLTLGAGDLTTLPDAVIHG